MKASDQQLKAPDVLLTVRDVMDWLKISQSSVYRLVEKRIVRFYKTRSGLRFSQPDIVAYLNRCCIEAVTEHEYGGNNN